MTKRSSAAAPASSATPTTWFQVEVTCAREADLAHSLKAANVRADIQPHDGRAAVVQVRRDQLSAAYHALKGHGTVTIVNAFSATS